LAPQAAQGAPLKKNGGAYARAVVNGIGLNIKDASGHASTSKTRNYYRIYSIKKLSAEALQASTLAL
jgi:predicted metallopeptidase